MSDVIIRDEKGRSIIKINDKGRIAIARFPDLSKQMKECIIDLYGEVTNEDPIKLMEFLDYKCENNEFCV
jgi:hypothetical protein